MTRPPDHDDAQDVARGSAAVDDEAHIAAHELGHDVEAAIDLVDELAAARERGDEAAADLHLQRLQRALQRPRSTGTVRGQAAGTERSTGAGVAGPWRQRPRPSIAIRAIRSRQGRV